MTQRQSGISYAAIQIFHWGANASVWGFVALLLGYYGFNSAQTGAVTASATLLSVALAPALSAVIEHSKRLTDRHGALLLALACGAIAAMLYGTGTRSFWLVAVSFVLIGATLSSAPPFHSAMALEAEAQGYTLNFGLSRGLGSIAYALMALLLGFVLKGRSPALLYPIHLACIALLAAALLCFRVNEVELPPSAKHESAAALLRAHPRYALTLLGCALFFACHIVSCIYIPEIAEKVGGDERMMGLVLAISAAAELPAMLAVTALRRKVTPGAFLRFSAAAQVVKFLLYYFACAPWMVYLAAALQSCQLGVFLPATVYYTAKELEPREQLKGQSLIHVAGSGLGAAAGSLVAGWCIALGGVRAALGFAVVSAVLALLVFCVSTRERE